ncbi:MAG TPA: XrtA/PEP-CTERM system exopolysaccharide export protein [Steroidobacteraceae bacterium]|nr:XrtA/PEP-CTERM system exopolysaccharide export protein [Steroidobacteraceae bacterium]
MALPRFTKSALVFFLTVVVTACAAPRSNSNGAVPAPAEPVEYRIGPGDTLNVFVWNHPELSVNIPVRPDGMISTPLAENTQAAGKTASQLARDLETALSEYVRSPKVNVLVTAFVGSMDQIRVVGQASHPQSLAYRADMTVLDVMIAVGGLGQFAAGNRAKVVRKVGGEQKEIPVRLNDLMNKGDMSANLQMMPGDVLIIPESRF